MVLARSIYRAGSHSMYQRILAVFLQEIVNVELYYLKHAVQYHFATTDNKLIRP